MKGTIVKCIEDLIITKLGKDKWDKIRRQAGFPIDTVFPITDFPDSQVLKCIEIISKELNISIPQVFQLFSEHWVHVYAPRYYGVYYKTSSNSRDFILKLNQIHTNMTKILPNSMPPKFKLKWIDPYTMVLLYKSHRNLADLAYYLLIEVGKYFKENLQVKKIAENQIAIKFPYPYDKWNL